MAAAAAEGLVLVTAYNNRAGFKGVTERSGTYQAQIKESGMMRHLGSFATPEEAPERRTRRRAVADNKRPYLDSALLDLEPRDAPAQDAAGSAALASRPE